MALLFLLPDAMRAQSGATAASPADRLPSCACLAARPSTRSTRRSGCSASAAGLGASRSTRCPRGVGRARGAAGRRRVADGRLGAQPGRPADRVGRPGLTRPTAPPSRTSARRTSSARPIACATTSWTSASGARRPWPRRASNSPPRPGADPRLRAQPRRARPSVDDVAPRVPDHRDRGGPRRHPERSCAPRGRGRRGPRPVLRPVARRGAAQRFRAGPARGRGRDAARHRRPVRRAALRHGDADDQRGLRAHLGRTRRARAPRRLLAHADRCAPRPRTRTSCSSPRRTGTWSGRCSNRDSTSATTSASTTAWLTSPPSRCAATCRPTPAYQERLLRFIENHDEPRAAATFGPAQARAAAVAMSTLQGARLYHDGQLDGRRTRIPVFLGRGPDEPPDSDLRAFYARLLRAVDEADLRDGDWRLCDCEGWPDNDSPAGWSRGAGRPAGSRHLVVVNLSDAPAQARVRLPWEDVGGRDWQLTDRLGRRALRARRRRVGRRRPVCGARRLGVELPRVCAAPRRRSCHG